MRESVIYQEILQEGIQRGLVQGMQQGMQQGKRDEATALVMRQLTRRFGLLNPKLRERIQNLSLTQLEVLAELLLDFTALTDLNAWLDEQEAEG